MILLKQPYFCYMMFQHDFPNSHYNEEIALKILKFNPDNWNTIDMQDFFFENKMSLINYVDLQKNSLDFNELALVPYRISTRYLTYEVQKSISNFVNILNKKGIHEYDSWLKECSSINKDHTSFIEKKKSGLNQEVYVDIAWFAYHHGRTFYVVLSECENYIEKCCKDFNELPLFLDKDIKIKKDNTIKKIKL